MNVMTIDRAIRALQQAREWVGGDAPLLMVDQELVLSFPIGDDCDCVYVTDREEEDSPWAAAGPDAPSMEGPNP
jgi:hypothetical protein